MRTKLALPLFLFATLFFLPVLANSANSAEVSKQRWINYMKTALPADFCKEEKYFRQCFEVSKQDCLKLATQTTQTCLDQTSPTMPQTLNLPQDGARFGRTVGSCAGTKYEQTFLSKRIDNPRCNDVNNWR